MAYKNKNISVISTGSWVPSDLKPEASNAKIYKIFIKKLVLMASIGIHPYEKKKKKTKTFYFDGNKC